MIVVIGSGPAGVSCTQALLAQGAEVTLVDAGQALEQATTVRIEALAATDPDSWTEEATAFLKQSVGAGSSGIRLKLAYGSNFPYRQTPGATPISCTAAETQASYARGGLSTVWGGAVLPYRNEDLEGWPVRAEELEPGYRAILGWMPLAACRDDLANVFPLFSDRYAPMPLSRQAKAVLTDLESNKEKLNERGVLFGASRLAVRAQEDAALPGCVACGLCMYGCPHRLIYSSDLTLAALGAHPNFQYRPGLTVRTVRETGNAVDIDAIDSGGDSVSLTADRVYLAAGVLETTSILLRSFEQYNVPVTLKDSQYFLLPLLRLKGTADVARERLHTLAQLFVEILDSSLSPYTVHLQTYTYNELFREPILAALGPARNFFPVEAFLGRLFLFQGYFHSAHSPSISMTLDRANGQDALHLSGVRNPETRQKFRKLITKLVGLSGWTGLLPLMPLLKPGQPGRGFHTGGTFPMRSTPEAAETDTFGRPFGARRIHAVDSTVFPTVPATTITFSVMANAYRIGSLLEQYS